jgi:hypothetical protein
VTGITARNSGDRYQMAVVRGPCFLLVNNFAGDSALLPAMTVLAQHVVQTIPQAAPVTLFDSLPQEDLFPGSARLVRGPYGLQPVFTFGQGDVLQLGGKIFAVLGEYSSADNHTYTQLVIPYPTATAAAQAYAYVLTHLDPYLTVLEQTEAAFTFQDYQEQFGIIQVEGRRMIIKIELTHLPVLH